MNKRVHKVKSRERGFTIIELAIVVIIIGIMLGAGVIALHTATRKTDVNAATEMIKEDLRRVYGLAASGEKPAGIDYRYRYRVVFNNNSESPPNSYVVERGTPNASGTYTYAPMTPKASEANRLSGDYIIPGSTTEIDYGTNKTIYFVSVGSINMANTVGNTVPGPDMTITVTGERTRSISISGYGNISD